MDEREARRLNSPSRLREQPRRPIDGGDSKEALQQEFESPTIGTAELETSLSAVKPSELAIAIIDDDGVQPFLGREIELIETLLALLRPLHGGIVAARTEVGKPGHFRTRRKTTVAGVVVLRSPISCHWSCCAASATYSAVPLWTDTHF